MAALGGQSAPKRTTTTTIPEVPIEAVKMPTTVGIKRKQATVKYDFDDDSD